MPLYGQRLLESISTDLEYQRYVPTFYLCGILFVLLSQASWNRNNLPIVFCSHVTITILSGFATTSSEPSRSQSKKKNDEVFRNNNRHCLTLSDMTVNFWVCGYFLRSLAFFGSHSAWTSFPFLCLFLSLFLCLSLSLSLFLCLCLEVTPVQQLPRAATGIRNRKASILSTLQTTCLVFFLALLFLPRRMQAEAIFRSQK